VTSVIAFYYIITFLFINVFLITNIDLYINALHICILLMVYFIQIVLIVPNYFLLNLPFEGNL